MRKLQRLRFSKGFTLIELLIVIGILGVLASTLLLALNPQESQRRARDTKRFKDAGTLQTIIDQMINDGITLPACFAAAAGCTSTAVVAGITGQPCTSTVATPNWLGVNVCNYVRELPVDPQNATTRAAVTGGTVAAPTRTNVNMIYAIASANGEYEINTRVESNSNAEKALGDGGDDLGWYELGSQAALTLL